MSLIFIEGFEIYDVVGNLNTRYTVASPANTIITTGRTGQCVGLDVGTTLTSPNFTGSGTVVVGMAFNSGALALNAYHTVYQLMEGATVHVDLRFNPTTGFLQVTRAGTVLATSSTALTANSWYYVEMKVVIHSTTGTVAVKVNQSADAALTLSSQNTRNGGTGVVNNIILGHATGTGRLFIDDIYILNSSGSVNNDFLGDMIVEALTPVDNGNSSMFTPVNVVGTATDNFAMVAAADRNYIESATVGTKDTYTFNKLKNITTGIAGISVASIVRNSNSTSHTINSVVRSGGTDNDSSTQTVSTTSFAHKAFITEQDPATTTAWTLTGVNTAQFGIKLAS
jgi:hypothetical protein